MRLFLAEKPSVGRELSKYLPGISKSHDGYISKGEDVITWAFGHMLQQAEPGDYDPQYKKWNEKDLPIVPKEWKLLITKSSEKQFRVIEQLLQRADVVVNAGDPDREGQLLIDEILLHVGFTKPVQRILINALDEKSIVDAINSIRDNKEFFNLRQSALARARADWLMGMNLSRAYTLAAQRAGHSVTLPVGRVKTPTLALVVRREEELRDFKPVQYYTLQVTYEHAGATFTATWQPQDTQKGLDSEGRLIDKSVGEALAKRLQEQPVGKVEKREKKLKRELQRLPLSLSSLQVLAGKAYGYSPADVLDIAQKLYERKFTTYPRSDCEYLPKSQLKDAPTIIRNSGQLGHEDLQKWSASADTSIVSRAWDDKKITAHHAIIPTTVPCPFSSLSTREQHIYILITQAYLAQFYPPYEYEQTKLTILHEDEHFVGHGRVVKTLGWKNLYSKTNSSNQEYDEGGEANANASALPPLRKGTAVTSVAYDLNDKTTKPPSRFTPSTLLQAMKEIHKYVKNDDLKKQLKEVSGIGTEATRATIIDDLIKRGFMVVKGKKNTLYPTNTAFLLVRSMPQELSYPDSTAYWEERLARMTRGEDSLENFLHDQIAFLTSLVGKARLPSVEKRMVMEMQEVDEKDKTYKCPRCKTGYFLRNERGRRVEWVCSNSPRCRTVCADVDGKPSLFS